MKYLLAVVLALSCIPTLLMAQTLAPDITIDTVPSNPQPGQTVTLTARSFSADLSQANLSWTYNGTSAGRGQGKTSIQIVAPTAGTTGIIGVTIEGAGIGSASATVTINPANIDLLWEAVDAYTPPFYKGKALLPVGGILRVTAVPAATAPKNLSFNWSRNGSSLADVSGLGRSSLLVRHSAFTQAETIEVQSATGSFVGSARMQVVPYAPLAIVYEKIDGFIEYARGFATTIRLATRGSILHIEPYYFSVPNQVTSDLTFDTTIDGDRVPSSQPNELALTRPENGGQSTLELAVSTQAYSLQHLKKTFTLLFN